MGSGSTQSETVSGEDSIMTTVSELTKETVYTVEVAAETRAGTGVNMDMWRLVILALMMTLLFSVTLTSLHLLVVLLLEETGLHQIELKYLALMSQDLPETELLW